MTKRFWVAALAGLSAAAAAEQQQPKSPEQSQPVIIQSGQQSSMVRSGTPVVLKTLTEMTTKGKHLKVGDRFSLEVAEPVSLNGQVVIPIGSNAVGEVTSVRNKGMWGKSGNIETRILYLVANDRKIRLSGSTGDKGVKAGGGAIAASAIVFLPAGFFMTGTSAVIPPGTRVDAILDEDIPVVFVSPQPMAVPSQASGIVRQAELTSTAAPAPTLAGKVLVKPD